MLAICKMSDVKVQFSHVDTFKQMNFEKSYTDLNPNSTVPMITEGPTKIIGDGSSLYFYLVNKHTDVFKKFYSEEQAVDVRMMMGWFQKTMRKTTSKLIRSIVNPKVFNQNSKKQADIDDELNEFFDPILGKLEETLVRKKYLTGEKITVIDIMFYCEIVTILKLYSREIPRDHCSCVADWFNNIAAEAAIVEVDNEFSNVC